MANPIQEHVEGTWFITVKQLILCYSRQKVMHTPDIPNRSLDVAKPKEELTRIINQVLPSRMHLGLWCYLQPEHAPMTLSYRSQLQGYLASYVSSKGQCVHHNLILLRPSLGSGRYHPFQHLESAPESQL
jgi:hypothetical protein